MYLHHTYGYQMAHNSGDIQNNILAILHTLLLPCCVLPFVVSVCYPQALSHTPSRERGNA